jgi:Flp pilus assembly protein TadB
MTTLTTVLALALAVLVWPARQPVVRRPRLVGAACRSTVRRRSVDGRTVLGGRGVVLTALRRRVSRGGGGDDVAEFVELLALSLRSGLPPVDAIQIAVQDPVGAHGHVRALAGQLSLESAVGGEPPTRGMGGSGGGGATAPAGWSLLRAAWALSLEHGSPLTEAVETSAAVLRARQASERRAVAARAGPRASMWLLTGLPVVGPLAALLMGVDPRATFGEPLALASLLFGLALTAAGWWWGSRIIRRAQAPSTWT